MSCNVCHMCAMPIDYGNIFCSKCNKSLRVMNQAKSQLRDSHGRFTKAKLYKWVEVDNVGKVTQTPYSKKPYYKATTKPCRDQMEVIRNHENRIKKLESILKDLL